MVRRSVTNLCSHGIDGSMAVCSNVDTYWNIMIYAQVDNIVVVDATSICCSNRSLYNIIIKASWVVSDTVHNASETKRPDILSPLHPMPRRAHKHLSRPLKLSSCRSDAPVAFGATQDLQMVNNATCRSPQPAAPMPAAAASGQPVLGSYGPGSYANADGNTTARH